MNPLYNTSLLRPFDLALASAGEPVLCTTSHQTGTLIFTDSLDGCRVIRVDTNNLRLLPEDSLRMAPLAWVEGKPVYKGDILYSHGQANIITGSTGASSRHGEHLINAQTEVVGTLQLTWTPPKTKKTFLAYTDGISLIWWVEDHKPGHHWKRVPSEDKTLEIEA